MGKSRKITDEIFKKEYYEKYGNEYTILGTYKNAHSKVLVRHNICGREYYQEARSIINGCTCRECSYKKIKEKNTNNNLLEEIEKMYPNQYTFLEQYKGAHNPILVRHNICGYEWKIKPSDLKTKKTRERFYKGTPKCPNCNNRHILTDEDFIRRLKELGNGEYCLLSPYINAREKVLLKHNVCGYEWAISPYHFTGGCRCPKCSQHMPSLEEEDVYNFLIKHIDKDKIKRNVRVLSNLELDIFIPEMNIGIEYCGLYWHSTKSGRDCSYHINKTKEYDKIGIRVIQIFSDEWKKNNLLVKDKILNILHLNTYKEKIYARKCLIKDISKIDKKIFLENNHIQGNDNSTFYKGLFYNDEIVAVMTMSKPRIAMSKGNETGYELTRFATLLKYNVVGGFSKLLSSFIKDNFNNIYSYADLRWSSINKNVYLTNGFEFEGMSKPNYWYFKSSNEKRIYRYQFRKSMLKKKFPNIYDDNKTEKQIMQEAGYLIIYDCGTIKYRLKEKI